MCAWSKMKLFSFSVLALAIMATVSTEADVAPVSAPAIPVQASVPENASVTIPAIPPEASVASSPASEVSSSSPRPQVSAAPPPSVTRKGQPTYGAPAAAPDAEPLMQPPSPAYRAAGAPRSGVHHPVEPPYMAPKIAAAVPPAGRAASNASNRSPKDLPAGAPKSGVPTAPAPSNARFRSSPYVGHGRHGNAELAPPPTATPRQSSPPRTPLPPGSSPVTSPVYSDPKPHKQAPAVSRAAPAIPPVVNVQGPASSSSPSPANRVPAGKQDHNAQPPRQQGIPTVPSSPYVNKEPNAPLPHSIWKLPPPPPNSDCSALSCPEPLTEPPIGSPCVCVLPMKVGLRLGVALYAFFPFVSDFAQELAVGVQMELSQVRVMGANVANDQPEKTVVIVDLVPRKVKFDSGSALSTYDALWNKKIALNDSFFGDYEVLYVLYPGLPPTPPSASANLDVGNAEFNNGRNSRTMKPLGVDVGINPRKKVNSSSSNIAIAVLSTLIAVILCGITAWLVLMRRRSTAADTVTLAHYAKSSAAGGCRSSATGSFSSGMATFTGQARTFRFFEIESATDGFDESKVLGEGGFGCVYQGTLEDGTRVAVKVLRRFDHQGEREFMSEVEMLGRLHHRNLVKLIGICVEESARCLVYELIPNGSVDSHLHGEHKESAPLDWSSRMKIALGAARGLAYLHEDSSPAVIHRDFKSSNILLEYDYTPKLSDFGLARAAGGAAGGHISTRVMGTFGYVAPEYAMTGHLLVKSDVYSYGVVLLELLTGRKPVDMSRPPGEENLVAWARPLLGNVVSLRDAIDPFLADDAPYDGVAKVAAIALMCVQPEVAHRPSMGEVVQALKLVCSEHDDGMEKSARTAMADVSTRDRVGLEAKRVLLSEMLGTSPLSTANSFSGSLQRHSSSGPLAGGAGGGKKSSWYRLRNFRRGSMSERTVSRGFETRSEGSEP